MEIMTDNDTYRITFPQNKSTLVIILGDLQCTCSKPVDIPLASHDIHAHVIVTSLSPGLSSQ